MCEGDDDVMTGMKGFYKYSEYTGSSSGVLPVHVAQTDAML